MSIPNHVSTTEVVLLERRSYSLLFISIGVGGFVSYLLRKDKTNIIVLMKVLNIVTRNRDFLLHQFLI